MPTQQEIREASDRFAALPHEEQLRIMAEQRARRAESQNSILRLQQHSDILQMLISLDQDRAREYIFEMGRQGVGKVSEELITEILAYTESAQLAKLNDLGTLAKTLNAEQVGNAIKNNTDDFGALLLSQIMKD